MSATLPPPRPPPLPRRVGSLEEDGNPPDIAHAARYAVWEDSGHTNTVEHARPQRWQQQWYQQEISVSQYRETSHPDETPLIGANEGTESAMYDMQAEATSPTAAPRTPFVAHSAFLPARASRGTKAHVPSACINCQRAHLRCSIQRPCPRCASMGKEESCVDVQHKKRGRPRLRDERDPRIEAAEREFSELTPARRPPTRSPLPSPSSIQNGHGYRSYRILQSQGDETSRQPTNVLANGGNVISTELPGSNAPQFPGQSSGWSTAPPTALLNMDLEIATSNQTFRDSVAPGLDIRGLKFIELVGQNQREKVHLLCRQLQEEREMREPSYLPPIYGSNEMEAIRCVDEEDIVRATRGSVRRIESLTVRLADGRCRWLSFDFRLAKTSVFFVALMLSSPADNSISPNIPSSIPRKPPVRLADSPGHNQLAPLPSTLDHNRSRTLSSGSYNSTSSYYTHRSFSPVGMRGGHSSQQSIEHPLQQRNRLAVAPSGVVGLESHAANYASRRRAGSGLDALRQDELEDLQLPPILSTSNSADSEDHIRGTMQDGGLDRGSEFQAGIRDSHRRRRRDRVDIEGMLE
ncbi:MAG: hypothetical protein M1827_002361 [Pycnora praestabilis]|nr:MAG: hypothetical protein M1827_002361 [Pycnora praestabilis]